MRQLSQLNLALAEFYRLSNLPLAEIYVSFPRT